MAKNTGIISTDGGNVVINGNMNVTGDGSTDDVNIGIITTGGDTVVINGSFNVGGKRDTARAAK